MKELYISPVLNVLCFAPVERLAGNTIDFETLLGVGGGSVGGSGPASAAETDGEDLFFGL